MSRPPAALLLALCALTAAPAAAKTVLPGFHSPSGTIRCLLAPGRVLRCDLRRADYAAALQARCMRPGGAGVDWHGFELPAARKGTVTCSGGILYNPGTQRPAYANLPYGQTWRRGPFTCDSRVTGVTCRNTGGHGLFVSRQSWRAW
ncbi:MAG TPA: DUF6636 domain-containing protein [Gaiellaceae bacterium]|nr:DUF6636 domain-containing protein [Gaiellaceae bacterium]